MHESLPKIMIIDDDALNLRVMVELLQQDYQTIVAKSGEKALQRLEEIDLPDLILLDVMMPGLSGYEVCQHLKQNPRTAHIPVIFITAKSEVEDEVLGFSQGGVDYITKPFNEVLVRARVKTHVELKRRGDILENLSSLDGLTQLANRRRFDEFLAFEWNRGLRTRKPLALILMDIDHFKLFNDTYGHIGGDDCLKQVAMAMKGVMKRSMDFVARYGGEEFACVLPETDLAGGRAVAERIRLAVWEQQIPHQASRTATHVTMSLGVAAVAPQRDLKPMDLITWADQALYEAKKAGRNQVHDLPQPAQG